MSGLSGAFADGLGACGFIAYIVAAAGTAAERMGGGPFDSV